MKAAAALLLLAGCDQSPAERRGGIVSTNPCADAMLVRLVAPERIAAISRYSHDPGATSLPLDQARRFRATAGTAEEVIALRPALVLASSFTPASTREAYARAGLLTIYLDSPTTVAASIAQVRQVAAALGERGRGEAMAREIDNSLLPSPLAGEGGSSRRLRKGEGCDRVAVARACGPAARLASRAPLLRHAPGMSLLAVTHPSSVSASPSHLLPQGEKEQPAALLYIAGDLANGSGTLLDELTRVAGFRNAAADYGLEHTGTLPAELLVAHPPAVVIAAGEGRTAALRRRLLPDTPQASFDRRLVNCGGPTIPAALARLRAIRASL